MFRNQMYWGRGETAFGVGQDRIRTLVSIALDSSHRGVTVSPRYLSCFFIESLTYLQVTIAYTRASMISKFGQIRPQSMLSLAVSEIFCMSFTWE